MKFVVDLTRASYLDSSALGMLLLLREHVGGHPGSVRIAGSSEEVRRVLQDRQFSTNSSSSTECRLGIEHTQALTGR
jgi:anti-anti-sigma factor